MSGKVVSWAMEQQTGSPAAKLVLVKLADNASEQGFCWPSVELIIEHTELGQSTVYKHLMALEEKGLFHQVDYHHESGAVIKAYQLHVTGWEDAIPRGGKGRGKIPPGGKSIPLGGNQIPGGGEAIPPGGIHNKEELSVEPPVNRHSNAADAAGESDNIASLGREDLRQWPAFRSVIAATWPGGFPDDNETAAKAEFAKQTRVCCGEVLVECARLHGQETAERQKSRSRSAGEILMKTPSNWLRGGDWHGYRGKVQQREVAEGLMTRALGNVARAVGPELFDYLRNGLEMSDEMIARLDGIELETGPPPMILVKSAIAKLLIEKHQFRLQRRLGDGLEIRLVATSPPKSSTAPN